MALLLPPPLRRVGVVALSLSVLDQIPDKPLQLGGRLIQVGGSVPLLRLIGSLRERESPPELFQTLQRLSQGLPELPQTLPEQTQMSTASDCRRSYRCTFFAVFVWDVCIGFILFESMLGSHLSRNCLKSICFAAGCPKKVKKTCSHSAVRLSSATYTIQIKSSTIN